jgi:hypothetical protein
MTVLMREIGLYTYEAYLEDFRKWVERGESSSPRQSHNLSHYTKLNLARTLRLHKTIQLLPEIQEKVRRLEHHYAWMVITEAWCGDSAQNLPVIAEIAKLNPGKIDLRIVLRDRNHELMDRYLTDGARAIPKLVVTDETTGKEVVTWGPRPAPAQALLKAWKKDPQGRDWDAFEEELHRWYAQDKQQTIQQELLQLINTLH